VQIPTPDTRIQNKAVGFGQRPLVYCTYITVTVIKVKPLTSAPVFQVGLLIYRQIDTVLSELIKVMISRRKEGRRAISVLWLY
jgi:hypothetical protein